MILVPCESIGSNYSTLGSLQFCSRFQVTLHLTLSLSPLIALLRWRLSRLLKCLLAGVYPRRTPSPAPTRRPPISVQQPVAASFPD